MGLPRRPVDLRGLHQHLGANFACPQCRGVGSEVRIARACGEDDDAALLEVPYRPPLDVRPEPSASRWHSLTALGCARTCLKRKLRLMTILQHARICLPGRDPFRPQHQRSRGICFRLPRPRRFESSIIRWPDSFAILFGTSGSIPKSLDPMRASPSLRRTRLCHNQTSRPPVTISASVYSMPRVLDFSKASAETRIQ